MQVHHILEIDFPQMTTAVTYADSPGRKARVLMMQIMDLFGSASEYEQGYIAWRMTKVANDLRHIVDRAQMDSCTSSCVLTIETQTDHATGEHYRIPSAA